MQRSVFALASVAAVCVTGCGHTVPRHARQRTSAPVAPLESKAPRPAVIEIRLLWVGFSQTAALGSAPQRTKRQALERAQMLSRMARSGDRFAELVRAYSDRPGAADDFGLFRLKPDAPGALGAAVMDAALALAPGRVGPPFEALGGFVVIERRPDPDPGPSSVGARHILISFKGAPQALASATRTETEARILAEEIARRAQGGEDWGRLAAQYTEEPGSKETGGDLGRFGHGQMVPAFERAAFALEVGAVSDVVSSPFGFHVIQRYE